MTDSRRDKLVGAVVSLPTFTDDQHNLLLDRQRKHIRWLIGQGITEGTGVLMASGGYGEGYFLEDDEFYTLTDVLAEEASGKVPTMMGIFDLSARAAARKARYAADKGIDFVELGMPHYSLPSEEDVFLHHKYVSDHADIGIMSYNNFWVMPPPGYEITQTVMERFADVENMTGFKWSSADEGHYLRMVELFSDRFSFIANSIRLGEGARLGMRGFVDFYGNVAPRLSKKVWELFTGGLYDELDALLRTVHIEPQSKLNTQGASTFSGVADGPLGKMRWELMGLYSGPLFPAQDKPSDEYVQQYKKTVIDARGGIMEWVDWDRSILE